MRQRFTAGLLSAALGAGLLTVGAPGAHASSKGRKNTTLGLGALSAYGLLTGKTAMGLLAGGGTAYAYKRYRDAKKSDSRNRLSRRYTRSPYRLDSTDGGFQFPVGYGGSNSGQYQYGSGQSQSGNGQYQYGGEQSQSGKSPYQYDGGQYQRGGYYDNTGQNSGRGSRPYVTDTWGRRHSYDPNQGDGFNRYDGRRYQWQRHGYRGYADEDRSSSSSRGQKRGWRGRSVPPGQWRRD
jgi:hypothetical protein